MPALHLSKEARRVSGLLLLSIVAVEFGGYSLLRFWTGDQAMTDFQLAFSRAGHAHAGVLVSLSLVCVVLTDATRLTGLFAYVARLGVPAAAILIPAGFFLSSMGTNAARPNGFVVLIYLGAVSLAVGVVCLGLGLLRGTFERGTGGPTVGSASRHQTERG
jgi:hypothetical protein